MKRLKKRKWRQGVACALVVLMSGSLLPNLAHADTTVPAEKAIPIESTFKNALFREYIKTYIDTNQDGLLSKTERVALKEIFVSQVAPMFDKERVVTLDGLEYFPNLKTLWCESNYLKLLNQEGLMDPIPLGTDEDNPVIKVETHEDGDGIITVKETRKDGTVTITKTDPDGNRMVTVSKPDGSIQTEVRMKDGCGSISQQDANNKVYIDAQFSQEVLDYAVENDAAAVVTMPRLKPPVDIRNMPVIHVSLPDNPPVLIKIPIRNPSIGTIAVQVDKNGEEHIIPKSILMNNGLVFKAQGDTTVIVKDNTKKFDDIDFHWGRKGIVYVTSRGIFNGVSERKFAPDGKMTRGMLATTLHNIESNPKATGGHQFADVADDAWYSEAVQWASEQGIITGYSDGTFGPNKNITREQLVTMLYRYAGEPAVQNQALPFEDANAVSDYAKTAMQWAVSEGLINGMTDTTLVPQGEATRTQVAVVLAKLINQQPHQGLQQPTK